MQWKYNSAYVLVNRKLHCTIVCFAVIMVCNNKSNLLIITSCMYCSCNEPTLRVYIVIYKICSRYKTSFPLWFLTQSGNHIYLLQFMMFCYYKMLLKFIPCGFSPNCIPCGVPLNFIPCGIPLNSIACRVPLSCIPCGVPLNCIPCGVKQIDYWCKYNFR